MTLAQAPAALRAAVGRTLGRPAISAGSAFQQGELTANNGAQNDQLGWSVSIDKSTAVVGAPGKAFNAGAAYVFTRSGTTWSQQAELTANDTVSPDRFGSSVAISGSTVVVSATGKNSGTGAAYVFTRSGTTWTQQMELTAGDAASGDSFGSSVAIAGSKIVVGAPDKNSETGAAYVFVHSGTVWRQQGELTASDGSSDDQFGYSVAISGSTAVVGAYGKNSSTGAAYVFVHATGGWSQQTELTASDAATGDSFGSSVAISGSTAVVGAYGKNSSTGAAYLFTRSGTTWSQQTELTAAGGAANDTFGFSVGISGSTVVVGSPGTNANTGAEYVFVLSGSAWVQEAEMTAADGSSGDILGYSAAISGTTAVAGAFRKNSFTGAAYAFAVPYQQAEATANDGTFQDTFGWSVAITGSTAVVGAPFRNDEAGVVYVFVRSGTTWSQQAELTATDGAGGDRLGTSVAISGTTVVAGAPDKNSNLGAAYVFVRSGTTWSQQAELNPAAGDQGYDFGTSVGVAGSTAVVGFPDEDGEFGSAYVFTRSGTTWSQQTVLTASDRAFNDFFGNAVAISGSTAVVGAYAKNSNTGAAYVFVRSGTTWSQQAKLTAGDGVANDYFGTSVAVSGSKVVVGAPDHNSNAGAAYVFGRSGTTWSQKAELTAGDGAGGDLFGWSVAISASTLVVGAYVHNSSAGAAYVFAGSGTTWPQQAELTAGDATAGDQFGWSVAISGTTALVSSPNRNAGTGAAYFFANM